MNFFKLSMLTILLMVTLIFTGSLMAEGAVPETTRTAGALPEKVKSLNNQVKYEIIDVMNLPVMLKYTDKNLKGSSEVTIAVRQNGKVELVNVRGMNRQLNEVIVSKINSRNLWTDRVYAGNVFKFIVKNK